MDLTYQARRGTRREEDPDQSAPFVPSLPGHVRSGQGLQQLQAYPVQEVPALPRQKDQGEEGQRERRCCCRRRNSHHGGSSCHDTGDDIEPQVTHHNVARHRPTSHLQADHATGAPNLPCVQHFVRRKGSRVRKLQTPALSGVSSRTVRIRCARFSSSSLMLIIFIPSPRPKTDKYPSGYPGDDESTGVVRERHPIRVHVRWTCHACSTTFKDLSKQCEGCGHDRCDECPRHPPKREKAKLDPDAVKSIEERMKTMGISPQASAA